MYLYARGLVNYMNNNMIATKDTKHNSIYALYHLGSSEYYHLVWKTNSRPPMNTHTPSEKYLRENLMYAKFDDELWGILQDAESREYIRRNIITRFLTKQ